MPEAQVRDVARLAGVSPATVSNAMNHPDKVSPATRDRVHAAIAELGFVRNSAAHQLRRGTNRAVGMVVLDVANPFFTDVARGVEEGLAAEGRPLILGNSGQDAARETAYLDLFEEQRVSGLLVTPVGDTLPRLRRLRDRGTSVVLVDRRVGVREFSSVTVDDRRGGRLATEHLLALGRTSVAFVGGPPRLNQVRHRLEAARAAVDAHGSGSVRYVETASMDAAAGRAGAERLLALDAPERPDAIFAGNDLVALGVLQALTRARVAVPDDIAIIGFDDIDFAASAAIPLTSVRQPAAEMGRTAATRLLEIIEDPSTSSVVHTVLEPELVVRESTAGPG
ncbi:LacI family DNA-binding transcriptional regulator [Nocardioides sp. CFH 31398]|uniref:LacI family DNA-binding transcriptional regulator n=1 Tax=Nocardioides sp. CFH 31398 TaxID=2919579 RepID=UPI001F06DF84|nr:LacI family DNA-binding transcriptional regulator [Nocardioides sp. CFH 31398]MCH1867743.1 LacI family transcriptional regulator [Nocardioides sp. CFH 31398]